MMGHQQPAFQAPSLMSIQPSSGSSSVLSAPRNGCHKPKMQAAHLPAAPLDADVAILRQQLSAFSAPGPKSQPWNAGSPPSSGPP